LGFGETVAVPGAEAVTVVVGRGGPAPTGRYKVMVALAKPTWYWQGKVIPPGPENGLGDRFIGINKKGLRYLRR
jgi:lipoprotein-anchoring transpeptidase ErfK/SrfK